MRDRNLAAWFILPMLMVSCQSTSAVPPAAVPSRTIEHAKGKSQIPISPQRVVVLDTAPLDGALALGIKPVGTMVYGNLSEYLGDKVDNIEIVGDNNEPNLETVLKLQPDLILGTKISVGEIYRQLSQIAPTVLTAGSGRAGEWQENFQLYADALGKSEQAEQFLQEYQDQVQQLQQILENPQDLTISVIAIANERIGTYTAGSFSGVVLNDIGFARNSLQAATWRYGLPLSRESLDQLDGDYIFLIYSSHIPGGTQKKDFIADPIWSQLEAVKQDRVCEVKGEVWAAGRSILAAQQILVDVESCLNTSDITANIKHIGLSR